MNRYILLIFFFLFLSLNFYGQEREYLDIHLGESPKDSAIFYRLVFNDNIEKIYFINDTLYMTGEFIMNGPKQKVRIGTYEFYHENGKMQKLGSYNKDGRKIGIWKTWYQNESPESAKKYSIKSGVDSGYSSQVLFESLWDSLGNQTINEGNGVFTDYHETGVISSTGNYLNGLKDGNWVGYRDSKKIYYEEIYTSGLLTEGVSYNKKGEQFNYQQIEENASFTGGDIAYAKFLRKNLKYPKRARINGTQGKIYVQFIIDKDGTISDVTVLKGIGHGCDEEAKRVISLSKKWTPGKQRGQSVRQRMVIPIVFRLG